MSDLQGSHDEMEISGMKEEILEITTFIFPNSSPPHKKILPKGSRKQLFVEMEKGWEERGSKLYGTGAKGRKEVALSSMSLPVY